MESYHIIRKRLISCFLNNTVNQQVVALTVKDREEYIKRLAKATVACKQLCYLFL